MPSEARARQIADLADEIKQDALELAAHLSTIRLGLKLTAEINMLGDLARHCLAVDHPAEKFLLASQTTETLCQLAATSIALIPNYRSEMEKIKPLMAQAKAAAH